jgi:hypothetical protein
MLIDYLEGLKPNMDYGSLESLAYRLIRLFWAEILDINPDQQNLHLAPGVAELRIHGTALLEQTLAAGHGEVYQFKVSLTVVTIRR